MGDWLKRKLIGLVLAIVGLAAWLGYHSLIGDKGSSSKELEKIPQTVFAGGGGDLTLAINLNKPAYLIAEFSRGSKEKEKIRAREELKEGDHYLKIDLPPDLSYGYFELGIPQAPVGSQLAWTVNFEGRELLNQNDELREPLKQNEAFFLQMEFSDLNELRSYAK
jgi:hypothetical protein